MGWGFKSLEAPCSIQARGAVAPGVPAPSNQARPPTSGVSAKVGLGLCTVPSNAGPYYGLAKGRWAELTDQGLRATPKSGDAGRRGAKRNPTAPCVHPLPPLRSPFRLSCRRDAEAVPPATFPAPQVKPGTASHSQTEAV
ncbi:hypothetical protein ZWY2020_056047 [Hordeum vulgare]|nr:hypothetical protein ZWY2020_056047 [Hordeum vulgare]